jgi:hypothetical protein
MILFQAPVEPLDHIALRWIPATRRRILIIWASAATEMMRTRGGALLGMCSSRMDEGTDTALTLPLEPSAIETASANGKARLQHGVLNFFAAMLRRVPVRRPVRRSWRYVIWRSKDSP